MTSTLASLKNKMPEVRDIDLGFSGATIQLGRWSPDGI